MHSSRRQQIQGLDGGWKVLLILRNQVAASGKTAG
jgi:hypothetical protein